MAAPRKKAKKKKGSTSRSKGAAKKTRKKTLKGLPRRASKRSSGDAEIWQVEGMPEQWDRFLRGHYVIPILLHDTETHIHIKAVILDLSATGCKVFTNDARVRMMDRSRLVGRTFRCEFDFYDLDTSGLRATVRHVEPGKDPMYERQLGLEFTTITGELSKGIRDRVQVDVARHKA
jgi:hypothetical protein